MFIKQNFNVYNLGGFFNCENMFQVLGNAMLHDYNQWAN